MGVDGVDQKKLGTIVAPFLTGGPGGKEAPSGSNSSLTKQTHSRLASSVPVGGNCSKSGYRLR